MSVRRIIAGVAIVLGSVLAVWGAIWIASIRLPAGALDPYNIASLRVLDRHGEVVREVLSREDGRANWVKLGQISPNLVAATLAGEDRRFFEHRGVDLRAVGRAVVQNITRGRIVSGASTITMQLVKLLDRSHLSRGWAAKIRQVVLATALERVLSKRQILWQYLNRVPYGNGTFGIEAASRRYFGRPASQLSLAQATLLAALPRAPSGYNPFSARGRRLLLARQRYLLSLMRQQGLISSEQHRIAKKEPFSLDPASRPFLAPHFVRRLLASQPLQQAISVQATIDLELQRFVEEAVRRALIALKGHRASNAAVLVVDNHTAEVLAYVGSVDFFDARGGQVDGVTALRQPGSTIKPFTYALALEQGRTPASLLMDLPVHFATDKGDYAPRNYDNLFHGPVRLRVALASSFNIPAVRLVETIGVARLLERLRAAGMYSLQRDGRHYGLGLTLGNGVVTLRELVGAYVALARGGRALPLRTVRRVEDAGGRWRSLPPRGSKRVFSRQTAYLITHILADPVARTPAFGADTPLDVGFAAAVKTGTSKDFRDNWTVGFTPEVTVGVWVGNFDGSPMQNVSGISGAGPLWAEVIAAAARRYRGRGAASSPAPDFRRPPGIVTARICPLSGALVGPHCPRGVIEHFDAGHVPRETCRFHRQIAVDAHGLRVASSCAASHQIVDKRTVVVYPPAYHAWAARRGLVEPLPPLGPGCTEDRSEIESAVSVRFPVDGDTYSIDPDLRRKYQRLPLEAAVSATTDEVRWLVDGRIIARARFPYTADWRLSRGRHTIVAALPDGRRSSAVHITVQ